MEYVLDANGNIVVKDGKPLVKGDDGKEFTIDAIGAQKTITQLHAESAEHRKKAAEYKKVAEAFEGVDPEAAKTALATVASMGDNHKVEVETLKNSLNKAWQDKYDALQKTNEELQGTLYKATVTAKFATSDVVKKTVLTPDIAATFFGKHFDANGVAKDSAGNTIFSKEKPGEPASFDEALEVLINAYPGKDAILRGSGTNGSSGYNAGPGSNSDVAAFYDKKSPSYSRTEQAKIANANPKLHEQLSSQFS